MSQIVSDEESEVADETVRFRTLQLSMKCFKLAVDLNSGHSFKHPCAEADAKWNPAKFYEGFLSEKLKTKTLYSAGGDIGKLGYIANELSTSGMKKAFTVLIGLKGISKCPIFSYKKFYFKVL